MKKALAIGISIFFFLILILGTSEKKLADFKDFRDDFGFLRSQKYAYGDLYGFSYMPEFRIAKPAKSETVEIVKNNSEKKINLYSFCDSYLYSFVNSTDKFNSVKTYEYQKDNDKNPPTFKIDTNQFNVLLVEAVERNIRMLFTDTNYTCSKLNYIKSTPKQPEKYNSPTPHNFAYIFFNPLIETCLEYCLFDYALFNPIRELKAYINYHIFDRLDKDVSISDDKKYLFYYATVNDSRGSFSELNDKEIDKIVASLNYINDKALKTGFDKVYFSFMPNPVSIIGYQNKRYNKLIPRIQTHKNLSVNVIDAYTLFRDANIQVFKNSDTHWNKNGFNMWMNLFNKELDSIAVEK